MVFLSRSQAESKIPEKNEVIISIHGANEPPARLHRKWLDRLTLCFEDTIDLDGYLPFSHRNAMAVLDFIVKHRAAAPKMYAHCSEGLSRSAGIALASAELLGVQCNKSNTPVTLESYDDTNRLAYHRLLLAAEEYPGGHFY